jgi:hypothetical protein
MTRETFCDVGEGGAGRASDRSINSSYTQLLSFFPFFVVEYRIDGREQLFMHDREKREIGTGTALSDVETGGRRTSESIFGSSASRDNKGEENQPAQNKTTSTHKATML